VPGDLKGTDEPTLRPSDRSACSPWDAAGKRAAMGRSANYRTRPTVSSGRSGSTDAHRKAQRLPRLDSPCPSPALTCPAHDRVGGRSKLPYRVTREFTVKMTLSDDHDSPFTLGSLRTTASHTIGIPHLIELLRIVPADAAHERYREAVVDQNVLGRPTQTGRQRSFRHLRELYFLDPARREFAAMRRLWDAEPYARPLLAGTLAFTRDGILRASFQAIQHAAVGSIVTSADLTKAVTAVYGTQLSEETLGKTGRNTGACWTQTGHLAGRVKKVRQMVEPFPAAVAFAAYLGHLAGNRGASVLDTPWAALLDLPPGAGLDALRAAHTQGLIDLLVAGDVVDVSFPIFDGSRG